MSKTKSTVRAQWLGNVDYDEAWELQRQLVAAVHSGDCSDQLLLLEHPPVYTLGRSGSEEHILFDADQLQARNISVKWVDRGGDITYHGPGQLVGYPILDLKRVYGARGYARPDLHLYLREVEETLIVALAEFGIQGWRYEGYTGVWVDGAEGPLKIAAIGIKVSSKGISSHGFALNVDPNLEHFGGIVPCGIHEHGVTSMSWQLRRPLAIEELFSPVCKAFSRVFGVDVQFVRRSASA